MICNECETVAHCMKNGCVPKTTKKEEAMKLALEAYMAAGFGNSTDFALQRKAYDLALQALKSVPDWASEAIEQPSGVATIAPVQGWKLVPVEPTEDMWKAVNKLDDEMAAGSYDGKGCSIEQAWDCLLAAAPQPAQQEPVAYMNPHGGMLTANYIEKFASGLDKEIHNIPLYTSPPTLSLAQRQARSADTWVGLTDKDIAETFDEVPSAQNGPWWLRYVRAIEAKLKAKNSP